VLKLESKDLLFVAFSAKETPVAKKPIMSRVGEVVITDR
jgi:hypothetical protein